MSEIKPPVMKYCSSCVYPASSAVPLEFDNEGKCSGCATAHQRSEVDWDRRKKMFERLVEGYRSKDESNYDCIIPVGGGKDSYYQIHLIKSLGLNPLLVTYHGYNYTKTGMKNLKNMREAFNCDHIFFTPSVHVLKAMNRLGMHMMGDMNWHNHCGIVTYPIRIAVDRKVPLMIWGEHGFMDLGGMHSYNDMIEFTYRSRHEHDLRGYEWTDFLESASKYDESLTKRDFIPFMYPSDEQIDDVGVRGIFISNYFKWEPNEHTKLMKEKYGFLESEVPFERTYRLASNLDDMHENGIHDYMKWVKFGYGRATDHVSKDIRDGLISREQGIKETLKRDPIKSQDIYRWLKYTGWSEKEFDRVADKFRDPRVWSIKGEEWSKKDIDGVNRTYGQVNLTKTERLKYYNE